MAKGLEKVPEGGSAVSKCYRLRMEEAARLAQKGSADYFYYDTFRQPAEERRKDQRDRGRAGEIYAGSTSAF